MTLERFSLAALARLDSGRVAKQFERSLEAARADCAERPQVRHVRRVVLTITMKPLHSGDQDLDSVDVRCDVKHSLPRREGKTYNMRELDGELLFNDSAPENARQGTLDIWKSGDLPKAGDQ